MSLSGACEGATTAIIYWRTGGPIVYTAGPMFIDVLEYEMGQVQTYGEIESIVVMNASGGVIDCCPDGYQYDPAQLACVPAPKKEPPPPKPPPEPPPTCTDGFHWDDTIGACVPDMLPGGPPLPLPPECGGDGCDWSQQVGIYLTVIVDILIKIQEQPEKPGPNIEKCCTEVVGALKSITGVLTLIANELGKPAPPGGPPPDFAAIVAALDSIGTAIANLKEEAPLDLTPVIQAIDRLDTATTNGDDAIAKAISGLLGPIPNPRPKFLAIMDYEQGIGAISAEAAQILKS
jgi:hypothetical protein